MEDTTETYCTDIPTITVFSEENENMLADDILRVDKRNPTITSHDHSFGNSIQNQRSFTSSMVQQSFQSSTMQHTQSTQHTNVSSNTPSQSMHNTHSIQTILTTRKNTDTDYSNTQSLVHTRYGSMDEENPNRFSRQWVGRSFRKLRSASLSISMLAKPSDDRKASSFLAGWNVSNLIQGTTILGIPYAIRQGGWAAVGMVILIGFLTCHTGKLLIECMYECSKKSGIRRRLRINYPEVAQAAFGKKGLIGMNIIQNSVMFGGVVMYIILLGTVWADLFRHLPHLGIKEWACINCCVTLPALFITKMSIISWFSMLSVFSIMSAFIILIVFCLTQVAAWNISNMPPFNIETFPIGFGIIMFSYCAHAVLPNIEGSMKNPKSYNSMMNISFSLASISKVALGVLMVMRFGDDTAEVITVNLNYHSIFSKITSCLVIANVLLAMPLEMFVVSISYDDAMLKYFSFINRTSGYFWVWLLISRPLLLTLSLLVAVTVPRFGLLMGLIGSVTGTSLCFIFPCYCHLKLRWDALSVWAISSDIMIILFGFAAGTLGLFFSIKGLVYS